MQTKTCTVRTLLERYKNGEIKDCPYNPAPKKSIQKGIATNLSVPTLQSGKIVIYPAKNLIASGHTRIHGLLDRESLGLMTDEEYSAILTLQECDTDSEFNEIHYVSNISRSPSSAQIVLNPNLPLGQFLVGVCRSAGLRDLEDDLGEKFLTGENNYLSLNLLDILFLFDDEDQKSIDLEKFSKGSHHKKTIEALGLLPEYDVDINSNLRCIMVETLIAYKMFLQEGISQGLIPGKDRILDELVGLRIGNKKVSPGFFAAFCADYLANAVGGFSKKTPKRLWQRLRSQYVPSQLLITCRKLVRRGNIAAAVEDIKETFNS